MSWFERFKRRPAAPPAPLDATLSSSKPLIQPAATLPAFERMVGSPNVLYLPPTFLTRGKWVMTDEGVGVVNDTSGANTLGVMLTHPEEGTDHRQVFKPVGQVRIATLAEIPLARRPDADKGRALGYV